MEEKKCSSQLEDTIFLKDVSSEWKSKLNTDKEIYILSPYITSEAEKILEQVKEPKKCQIFTTFELKNFLYGSSDIKTLQNLIKKDFKIYKLPELHAKIILVKDTFVSIGSQNLTLNGTTNKEATVISREKEVIECVELKIKEWVTKAEIVDIENEEFRDLKKRIEELKEEYEKLNKKIEEFDLKKETERQTKSERFEKNLKMLSKNEAKVTGKIIGRDKYHSSGGYVFETYIFWSFKPNPKGNLIEIFNLKQKQTRYFALNYNSHQLGWARVNENSISLFADGVTFQNEKLKIAENYFPWSVKSNWDLHTLSEFNLVVTVELREISNFMEIKLFFDCKSLSIYQISPKLNSPISLYQEPKYTETVNWIFQNEPEFTKEILGRLLTPFNYENKLLGSYADKFLKEKQNYELTIGEIDNQKLLIFKEQGFPIKINCLLL